MTAVGSARPADRARTRDLSSAFGPSAAASLRRRRPGPPRRGRGGETPAAEDDHPTVRSEPVARRNDDEGSGNRRPRSVARSAGAGAPAPTVAPSRSGSRPRTPVVRVRDRGHVDVLLLAVAGAEPTSGSEFIDLVRARSHGAFTLPERTVYHELHRLENDRLIRQIRDRGRRRYLLTALGERVLASRRRQWEAFSSGFTRVLAATDDDSGPTARSQRRRPGE